MSRADLSRLSPFSVGDVPSGVEVRVLGELEVLRGGQPLALPTSKKARALLGYLVLTRRFHRRERLARLLWDVADDSRGALRWTLSRVRSAIEAEKGSLLVANRDEVRFEHGRAMIDYFAVPTLLTGGEALAPVERLEAAAALFRGEMLEGCDLPDFFDFTSWLAAERDTARRLHLRVLSALTERLEDLERALPYARARVRLDPLDEASAITFMRHLVRLGRRAEAEEYVTSVVRALERTGFPSGHFLGALRAELRVSPLPPRTAPPPEPTLPEVDPLSEREEPPPASLWAPFLGRERELATVLRLWQRALLARRPTVVVVAGEPGVGKSRFVSEIVARWRRDGVYLLRASAFETDRTLPFLPWMELLRGVDTGALDVDLARDLSPLLLTGSRAAPPSDRDRLFRATAQLCKSFPALVLDDAQWLDDASTTLLHHVLRSRGGEPLFCVLAVRRGELVDNPALVSLLRGARRDKCLSEIELEPLDGDTVAALARAVNPSLDPARVVRQSRGNPLIALELSRWLPGPGGDVPGSLREIVSDRVARLPALAQDVLKWAVVLGSHFTASALAELMLPACEGLLHHLEMLERYAFLQTTPSTPGHYTFCHSLVERAIYLEISEPRRRLMHQRIAEHFSNRGPEDLVAGDVSRHAALAGDSALAAEACLRAAQRSLRVFANDEARRFARRGLRHATVLEASRRVPLEIHLRSAAIRARRPSNVEEAAATLLELGEQALVLGHASDARAAYHLVSLLRWEVGRFDEAAELSLSMEAMGRAGSPHDRARAMADAAYCLALLERQLPLAEAMLLEAEALRDKAAPDLHGINGGYGVLHRHRGEYDAAAQRFLCMRTLCRIDGNRVGEFAALAQLIEMGFEQGDMSSAQRDAEELLKLGERLREGSEPGYARALYALTRWAQGDVSALTELEASLDELRLRDATHRLTTVLLYAAELELRLGLPDRALGRAEEALQLSTALERPSDIALARSLLVRAHRATRFDEVEHPPERPEQRGSVGKSAPQSPDAGLSFRARHALSLLEVEPNDRRRPEEP